MPLRVYVKSKELIAGEIAAVAAAKAAGLKPPPLLTPGQVSVNTANKTVGSGYGIFASVPKQESFSSPTASSITHPNGNGDPHFDEHRTLGVTKTLAKFHELIFSFANNNNLAIRTVANAADCPEFKRMIFFACQHGQTLIRAPRRDLCLGVVKFGQGRVAQWELFVQG